MNILLTNDDGFSSDGLSILREYFETKKEYNIFIVAPDTEKSGYSHSITFTELNRVIKHYDNIWIVRGTPADCVNLALLGMIDKKIDLVISGINHGPNMGRDTLYSGTVGAARQGAFCNVPSMALSLNTWSGDRTRDHFDNIVPFFDKYFDLLLKYLNTDFVFNINFPNIPYKDIKGIKNTIPYHLEHYDDELFLVDGGHLGKYYGIKWKHIFMKEDIKFDACAIKNGFISVSALKILPEGFDLNIDFV